MKSSIFKRKKKSSMEFVHLITYVNTDNVFTILLLPERKKNKLDRRSLIFLQSLIQNIPELLQQSHILEQLEGEVTRLLQSWQDIK